MLSVSGSDRFGGLPEYLLRSKGQYMMNDKMSLVIITPTNFREDPMEFRPWSLQRDASVVVPSGRDKF